jgi:hypothetical protein
MLGTRIQGDRRRSLVTVHRDGRIEIHAPHDELWSVWRHPPLDHDARICAALCLEIIRLRQMLAEQAGASPPTFRDRAVIDN